MDFLAFTTSAVAAFLLQNPPWASSDDSEEHVEQQKGLQFVNKENIEVLLDENENVERIQLWHRASFILVMHDPPHLYYQPKWSYTSVLLVQHEDGKLSLPSSPVQTGETFQTCAVRTLRQDHEVDVYQPENCLHHLFMFPFAHRNEELQTEGVWADFYECVFRGSLSNHIASHGGFALQSVTLEDLKQLVAEDERCKEVFLPETCHALKLYFQRQDDLYIQRRIMKGYSSMDLEHYGMTNSGQGHGEGEGGKIVFLDTNSFQRQEAVEFTMRTDDGMSPKLLPKADVVLLGVSRVGKSPLSLFLAQTSGLKVANVPLVQELKPPKQLLEEVDSGRVFCLTMNAPQLQSLRRTRFRREMKRQLPGQRNCVYADADYVRRDLDYAQSLCHTHGFTELNITNRAIEENASLIVSKMKERFPDLHIL